jgi:hypothetical protein
MYTAFILQRELNQNIIDYFSSSDDLIKKEILLDIQLLMSALKELKTPQICL